MKIRWWARQVDSLTPGSTPALSNWRSSPWRVVFTLALAPLVVGVALVLPHANLGVLTTIGAGLIGGSIIGLVFALVQFTMDQRSERQSSEADLRLQLISNRELPGVDLSSRSLPGIYLYDKVLHSARLREADLTGATLDRAKLQDAILTGARLDGGMLRGVKAQGANLSKCSLRNASLTDANLENATAQAANFDGADFSGARLGGADLSRSSLRLAQFEHADLTNALLIGVRARGARMARAVLSGSTLQYGDFTEVQFAHAHLDGARLNGANLSRAILIMADLSKVAAAGSSFARADLSGCRLNDADLRFANFTDAVLMGCDFRGADLTGAQLSGVQGLASSRSDANTRWPESQAAIQRPVASPATDLPPVPSDSAAAAVALRPSGAGPKPNERPRTRLRRVIVFGPGASARAWCQELVAELLEQQRLSMARKKSVQVSLPLGARSPGLQRFRARQIPPFARPLRRSTGHVRIWLTEDSGTPHVHLRLTIGQQRRRSRPGAEPDIQIPVDTVSPGQPSVTRELAARILVQIDPRDGASWQAQAHVVAATRLWDRDSSASAQECRRELNEARKSDPLSPVVNYALGALAYNEYEADYMRQAVEYFSVAKASADRLTPQMVGLVGLCLSGAALAYAQLYHRFGMQNAETRDAGRTAAAMAVETTQERLRLPGLSKSVRVNAAEGFALALYAQAFTRHVTEELADVSASIPLYEKAIDVLESNELPVPAVLFNNLGYQHMSLAGLKERGPDAAKYREARRYFETARDQYPDLYFAWANLGNVDRLLGQPVAAEASYRRAIEIRHSQGHTYPQGCNELACVLLQLGGRDDEARSYHRRAIDDVSSPSVRAHLRAEFADSLTLVGQPDEAVRLARLGLDEDPDNKYCKQALADAAGAL